MVFIMKFLFRIICIVFLIGLTWSDVQGQALPKQRKLAILDMSDRNNEGNDYLYSCKQMATVAGVPFEVTKSIPKAANHKVVMLSSYIDDSTFTQQERLGLEQYVQNGGILFGGDIKDDTTFYKLFGINEVHSNNTHYRLQFQPQVDTALFTYFNHPLEKTIALGDSTYGLMFYTHYYDYDSAEALAYLDGDTSKPALLRHQYQQGSTYAFGMKFRDVMVRYLMNRDFSAERVWSNGFEPSGDMMPLLLRSLCAKHMDHLVWKHTAPRNYYNTVMLTHDIDSRTGMDTMLNFAKKEYQQGIKANYNITTRYFTDSLWTDFYTGKECKVDQVKAYEHVVSSHSVGHFIDFHEFGFGPEGLTKDQYQPFHNGTQTSDGHVLAETEVSKNLLEANHNIPVRTFRAGHLRYPDKLGNALDSTGYQFNSTNSANSILYSFPFPIIENRSFDGQVTDVYEIPVTFSDVYSDSVFNARNYKSAPNDWLQFNDLYAGNYSPVNLLIHPNRNWKLKAQNYFINNLGPKNKIMNMNAYGEFWKNRAGLEFSYEMQGSDHVVITIPKAEKPLDKRLSFGVKGIKEVDNVTVKFESGSPLNYKTEVVPEKDHLLVYTDQPSSQKSYVTLPFSDSFESVDAPMKKGWAFNFPNKTHGFGSFDQVMPAGAKIWDTSQIAKVAYSGKGALALGPFCKGQNQVAAIDLQLDLGTEEQVTLNYQIKSNGDEPHPQDGIFASDNGGKSFSKIYDFNFPDNCEGYFKQPTLDIDELAAQQGLSLTNEFIIRFQQYDDQSLFKKDGIFMDDISVKSRDSNTYADIPYHQDFEKGLGNVWETNPIDSQNRDDSIRPELSSFAGIMNNSELKFNEVARSGKHALAFGKTCGIHEVVNRADLYVDLSEADEPLLEFYIKNNEDDTHERDGIWLSNDAGQTFTKIRDWQPERWCDEYTKHPIINLKESAGAHDLSLNDQVVIRFQQQDNYNFTPEYHDGYFIDDLSIVEASEKYAELPVNENFEGNFELDSGWSISNAPKTHLGDTASIGPHGWIGIMDTSRLKGIAASGAQAIGLGKICEGSTATNALDLQLNLSEADKPVLTFKVLSYGDENDAQDGLWMSDDGGERFTKVLDFEPEDLCDEYGSYPPIPLEKMARKAGLELSDQFIIRFQQKGDNKFESESPDGLFIDDVAIKDKSNRTWAELPFSEDFESRTRLTDEWGRGNALFTGSNSTRILPNGFVEVIDSNGLSGVANSGNKGLALGKNCDGEQSTNAMDLYFAGPNCENFRLTYHINRHYDDPHSDDGIWVSNDQGKTFHKIHAFNFKRAANEYHSTVLNLDTAMQNTPASLKDSLILRFQQSDNNDFVLPGRDGFFFDDFEIECTESSGIKSETRSQLKIYPNPVKDRLKINSALLRHEVALIRVSTALGKTVMQRRLTKNGRSILSINTESLDEGVYFLTVETAYERIAKKFIKVGH